MGIAELWYGEGRSTANWLDICGRGWERGRECGKGKKEVPKSSYCCVIPPSLCPTSPL